MPKVGDVLGVSLAPEEAHQGGEMVSTVCKQAATGCGQRAGDAVLLELDNLGAQGSCESQQRGVHRGSSSGSGSSSNSSLEAAAGSCALPVAVRVVVAVMLLAAVLLLCVPQCVVVCAMCTDLRYSGCLGSRGASASANW